MKNLTLIIKPLAFLVPVSLLVAAGLAALQPGVWWIGWLGFSVLLLLGLLALIVAWKASGGGRVMAWMLGLAFVLRLAAGVATSLALPIDGYNVPDDKAGYVFTDAHRRDDQAWELAQSGKPLYAAFDKTFYTDQYGGLLAISAVTYKLFSPDAHRPWIIVLLAALTAALGVPFLVRVAGLLWNDKVALAAGWLFVLYPESVLTGGAQMREPFLLTFIAMALCGFARWIGGRDQRAWWWIAGGLVGMLLVSPAIAVGTLVLLAGWLWSRGEHRRVPWPILAAGAAVLLIGVLFLAWSLARQSDFSAGSSIGVILNWIRNSVKYVFYDLERGSGQIQQVFRNVSPLVQLLFVLGYGVAQPVLPPAFFEPTTLTWHVIAVLRASGWYLLLPLLLFAPIAGWRSKDGAQRRSWIWLSVFSWSWILICALRAGGDQWDNPRYRLIFFGVQALLAGYAWVTWQEQRDPWLPRILGLEVVCVLLFGEWYVARYLHIGVHLPVAVVLALCIASTALIFGGGWLWDGVRSRKRQAQEGRRV